jgi:hypothetical protein
VTEAQIAELLLVKETESGEPRRMAVYHAALVALPRVLEERKRLLEALSYWLAADDNEDAAAYETARAPARAAIAFAEEAT